MRFTDHKKPPDKRKLFELLQRDLKVPLTALREVKSGYNAFTELEGDVERLLTEEARRKLKSIGLEVKLPPKVKANRAVICRQIDPYVGERTKEEIHAEIEHCNSSLKVAELIKFGNNTHVFKVEFTTTEMAQQVIERGFLCCSMRISPSQIQREEFIDVLTCFTCYKLDSHATKDCPTPRLIVCSECTGDHSFRDCTAFHKKCLNCGGDHRTMAMACPKKKDVIKKTKDNKKTEELKKAGNTYAQIVKETIKNVNEMKQAEVIQETTTETGMRAMIMVMDAHLHNIVEPGTYSDRLNATLKANNIKPIVFPESTISDKLFNHELIGQSLNALHALEKNRKKSSTTSSSSSSSDEEEEDSKDTSQEKTQEDDILERHDKVTTEEIRNATEYDIELIVPEGKLENKNVTAEDLKTMYGNGTLKFVMLPNSKFTADQLDYLILQGKIKEKYEKIKFVTEAEFKRTKTGSKKVASRKPRQTKN